MLKSDLNVTVSSEVSSFLVLLFTYLKMFQRFFRKMELNDVEFTVKKWKPMQIKIFKNFYLK